MSDITVTVSPAVDAVPITLSVTPTAGLPGVTPVIVWVGDQLSINGVLGPHLTGASPEVIIEWISDQLSVNGVIGPHLSPVIEWVGDQLSVNGVLGPHLTGIDGADGNTYDLTITGGIRSITFDAAGSNPVPAQTAFGCTLYENGVSVTPATYSWSATGHLSGTSATGAFTPTCAGTFDASYNNSVTLTVTYDGQTITRVIPIAAGKIGATGAAGAAGAPMSLLNLGMPMINPPAGTIGNNGALTLGTSLGYIVGPCYMYFAADKVSVGRTAGLYYTIMSSTTVGVIYDDRYTGGQPQIPASPIPIVATGGGAYPYVSVEVTLASCVIPGGDIGQNGSLVFGAHYTRGSSASATTLYHKFVGVTLYAMSNSTSGSLSGYINDLRLTNRGQQNKQIMAPLILNHADSGISNSSSSISSFDTTVDQTFAITSLNTNAAQFIILERANVGVIYGA